MSQPALSGLLEATANGDKQAFATLYALWSPRVRSYVAKRCQGQTADELTQEVFLTLWKKAPQFDSRRGSASAWLFTIARNVTVDHGRRQRPTDPLPPVLADAELEAPDRAAARLRRAERVRAALDSLPDDQRDALHAAYFGGETLKQIAETHAVPLGTIKSRVRLAMQRLRSSLGGGCT